jgi:hypothetical protein
MTVLQLRNKLNKLMEQIPNTTSDEIYFYGRRVDDEPLSIDIVKIEWDLNDEGR